MPKLSRHQKSLHDKLAKIDQKREGDGLETWRLPRIYLGALWVMKTPTNPDCFAQAAHSFRELMEKVAWSLTSIEVPSSKGSPPGLKALVKEFTNIWDKAKRNTENLENGEWKGNIDKHTAKLLGSLDGFIHTANTLNPSKAQQGAKLLKQTDLQPYPLPEPIEKIRLQEWRSYDEYFQGVAHHRSVPIEDEFYAWVVRFEEYLLARLAPKTSRPKKALLAIIRQGEGHANP